MQCCSKIVFKHVCVCVNLHITSKVKLEISLCNILSSCLLFSKNKEITQLRTVSVAQSVYSHCFCGVTFQEADNANGTGA